MNDTQLSVGDIAFLCVIVPCGFVGVLGNFMVIFIASKLPRASYTWFIISMTIADTGTLTNDMTLQTAYFISKNETLCSVAGFITYVCSVATMLNVPLLCINRFVVFYYSIWEEKLYSNTGTLSMIVISWIISISTFLPYLLTDSVGFEYYELSTCGIVTHGSAWKIGYYNFALMLACMGYGVTCFCNFKVYQKVQNHAKFTGQFFETSTVKATHDVLKLTVCMTICPCLFQLPGSLAKPWINGNGRFFSLLFHFNACLNPARTIYFMKPLYREFLPIIHKDNTVQRTPPIVFVM